MKYEITGETLQFDGRTLHRIKALVAIPDIGVDPGDLGGYVESSDNLSQEGTAWIADDAKVYGAAQVYGDAEVCGYAQVCATARVFGYARVFGNAMIYGEARVIESARVFGYAHVYGEAGIGGHAMVYGKAIVCGEARVYGAARVCDGAAAFGKSRVSGHAMVYGTAKIGGEAVVMAVKDFIVFKNFWSSGRYFTWTRSDNMYQAGCFRGTGTELVAKAYRDSEMSGREYGRVVRYVESVLADMAADGATNGEARE